MTFTQNNLNRSASPYLLQHKDNPIWWQEWSGEVLAYAKKEHKPLFVSVGYSTCHWCHVMAAEAFQDQAVADYLNEHFVAIKVDREQRPDIDRYLMAFIASIGGQGGWPLNCFLLPDLKPVYAMTYAGLQPVNLTPGFLDILKQIRKYCDEKGTVIEAFAPSADSGADSDEDALLGSLWDNFDSQYGGFGAWAKFPPHSTLLFLLYYFETMRSEKIKVMIERTLEAMLLRGLHDHLQGGFFRYCTDRGWGVPHFEKMLYDQALLLWAYSLAYALFKNEAYSKTAFKLLVCLKDTFEEQDLYYSGHDADTDHQEGATYLWTSNELKHLLTPDEFRKFADVYAFTPESSGDDKGHLIKTVPVFLNEIEDKLLAERKKRRQPFVDKKIVTSWNALLGIGFIHAYRYLGHKKSIERAKNIARNLFERHYVKGTLAHSSFNGELQKGEFLQDYAALLLLSTYLYEETGQFKNEMDLFRDKVLGFRKNDVWQESFSEDFYTVPADPFDHPIPSSTSLAEYSLLRAEVLTGGNYSKRRYKKAFNNDFMNIAGMLSNGLFHVIEAPQKAGWSKLPLNSIQVRGTRHVDCYQGACRDSLASPLNADHR